MSEINHGIAVMTWMILIGAPLIIGFWSCVRYMQRHAARRRKDRLMRRRATVDCALRYGRVLADIDRRRGNQRAGDGVTIIAITYAKPTATVSQQEPVKSGG